MRIVVHGPVINKTNVSLNYFSDLFSQFKYLRDRSNILGLLNRRSQQSYE